MAQAAVEHAGVPPASLRCVFGSANGDGPVVGSILEALTQAAPGRCVWAALLTPQGKWLADFFIFARPDALLLECERAQAPMLAEKLGKFRLRSKVGLRDASNGFAVVAGWGEAAMPEGAAPDPRLPEAGWRGVMESRRIEWVT